MTQAVWSELRERDQHFDMDYGLGFLPVRLTMQDALLKSRSAIPVKLLRSIKQGVTSDGSWTPNHVRRNLYHIYL